MAEIIERGFVFDYDRRPTPSCHASTVCAAGGGYLCAWFGGTRESAPDVGIWLSRYRDGVWSVPRLMSGGDGDATRGIAHWNPVLFADGGKVYLFYKVGVTIPGWKTCLRTAPDCPSPDGEFDFSPERELVPGDNDGGRGPVKNKPLRLRDGTMLCPASREYAKEDAEATDGGSPWRVFFDLALRGDFSALERTEFVAAPPDVRLIQPSLWEDGGGAHALMRSANGCLYRTDSSDGGRSWCPAYPTDMPNNNSGFDLCALPDGRICLVSNPVRGNWGKRTPLTLSLSADGGKSFEKLLDLETEDGEFSYPSVIYEDGLLRIVYTHRRERIAYAFVRV